tara:strand:+ start:1617 stop:1922 length:306 start_codon:yes stop_codon:yes gene_type:complete
MYYKMPYVSIKSSDKAGKKLMAVFTRHNGSKKTIHFGQASADDYTITKDKEQRKRYLDRHRKNENWNKAESAGALSRWILWGPSTSRRENIKRYKKRFKLL